MFQLVTTFYSISRDYQVRKKNEIWLDEKVYKYEDRSYQVRGFTKSFQKYDWDFG